MEQIKELEKEIELLQKKLELLKEIKIIESSFTEPMSVPSVQPVFDHLYRPNQIYYNTISVEDV